METSKVKKRAARACSFCRGRKVRCIVAGPSEACANCKYHEKQCSRTGVSPQSPAARGEVASTPPSCATVPRQDPAAPVNPLDYQNMPGGPPPQQTGPATSSVNTPMTLVGFPNRSDPIPGGGPPPPPFPAPQSASTAVKSTCHPTYSFLRNPDLHGILAQDLSFLVSQGCFMVPQRSVLDEFMRQYFRHVHPMLPLLNEADVWKSYKSQGQGCSEEEKISILVLQGILFTSCGFVSLETLSTLGFRTHQESKWAFYRRAKLLYDFGCESSPITKAQGALLLAQSHLIPRPLAGNTPFGSIWLSVAIHFARDANAHRYASYLSSCPADLSRARKLQNTLKRLWWCCVICDRVFPLSSRRDIKITRSNFDFAGSPALDAADMADEMCASDVYDPATKALLAEVLRVFVELCVVLTDVLTVTSVLHNHPSWEGTVDADKLSSSKEELQRWYDSWAQLRATIEERSRRQGLAGPSTASVMMTTRLLDMYYHSARQALCHAEILQYSIAGSPGLLPYALEKTDELQCANSRVTECLVELNNSQATRWLPMTAIGCTALPLALHLIDVDLLRRGTETGPCSDTATLFANYKRSRLSNLSEAMATYRPKYYIVDWVVKAVYHIAHLANQVLSSVAVREGLAGLSPSSWTELLQLMPTSYLRLVITLEMSIGQGKLPEESDFPPTLRGSAQISFSVPDVGRFLQIGAPAQREEAQEEKEEQGRVTDVTEQGQLSNMAYDFGVAAATGFMGDDMPFYTPQPGPEVPFQTPQPAQGGVELDPPHTGYGGMPFEAPPGQEREFSGSVSQPEDASATGAADLGAIFGDDFQGGDDFDEWANRVLGVESIPF